jgi:hypothetical protein
MHSVLEILPLPFHRHDCQACDLLMLHSIDGSFVARSPRRPCRVHCPTAVIIRQL